MPRPRDELGIVLDHIQENADRLRCDSMISLAETMARMSDDDGVLRLDGLPDSDVRELWGLVDDIARENGVAWEVADGNN